VVVSNGLLPFQAWFLVWLLPHSRGVVKVPPLYGRAGRVSTTLPEPFQAIATLTPHSQGVLTPRLSFILSSVPRMYTEYYT